jgi:hypothetical protein
MSTTNGIDPGILRLQGLVSDGTSALASFLLPEERSRDVKTFHEVESIGGQAFYRSGLLNGFGASDSFVFT